MSENLTFFTKCMQPTWADVVVGHREGWVSAREIVRHAESLLDETADGSPILELAELTSEEYDSVGTILQEAVSLTAEADADSRLRWMRVWLARIYNSYSDETVLQDLVEKVYADFGYPTEIQHLIRYEPTHSPAWRNADEWKQRLTHYLHAAVDARALGDPQ